MSGEELYLVIGCFGRRDDNFISCSGIDNRILNIKKSLIGYDELMDYLENIRLFDKPLHDVNGVRNCIFFIQNTFDQGLKKLWSEKNFHLYQKFILDHRFCGTYIKLILVDKDNDFGKLEPEPEQVYIKAGSTSVPNMRRIK